MKGRYDMKHSRSVIIHLLRVIVSDARPACAVALAWLFLTGVVGQAGAAVAIATWTGASNGVWLVNANWSPTNGIPSNTADRATFNSAGNGQTNVTITGTVVLGNNNSANKGLVFDTPNAAAYTISGGTIAAPNTSGESDYLVVVNPSVISPQTINSAVTPTSINTANGGFFVNYSPAAPLTMGGSISHTAVSTGNTNAINFFGLGDITVSGAIADGPSNKTAISNVRGGTTTLSGVNTFSGFYSYSGSLSYNLMMGLDSTLVLDYANMAVSNGTNVTTVVPNGTKVNFGNVNALSGRMVFRGISNTAVVTSQTLGNLAMVRGMTTFVVDRNGGGGMQLTLGTNWAAVNGSSQPLAAFDLSSGGTARLSDTNFSGGNFSVGNGVIGIATSGFAASTVKHTNGKTYFGTLDTNGNIIAQTNLAALPASGSGSTVNYVLTNSLLAVGSPSVNTLRIEPSAPGQMMNLGTNSFTLTRQSILLDSPIDYVITNGVFSSPLGINVVGTGKLTVQTTLKNSAYALNKFGPGLLELTGTNSLLSLASAYLYGGVTRVNTDTALPGGNLIMGTAVLEIGFDFVRALGTGAGQLYFTSGGFSACGGNHFVNISGTSVTLPFGIGITSFITSRDGKLMLSSSTSDSTIDFQNPLNLSADQQTVEVGNGAATVDAVLSGLLSNGGLIKTGAGTLSLTSSNTYTLGTMVGAGTLLANNTVGSGTGTGTVTICAGATLGGSGTIVPGVSNLVWIGGTLAPGAGTATNVAGTALSINLGAVSNKVQFASGATATFKFGAPGSADQIRFLNFGSGKLTLSNTTINVANAGGYGPGQYTLMSFYSDNGTVLTDSGKPTSGLILGTAPSKLPSRIDYTQTGKIVLRVTGGGSVLLFR